MTRSPAPLRPLHSPKFSTPPVPSTDLHDRPELCLLPLSSLVVDPRYQREIGTRGYRNVRRILERFDWRKFQPIVVTKADGGRYAIIDGQHRATAALMHPEIDLVPCMIVAATVREAAECFSAINGSVTAVTAIHLFRARVAAGEKTAIAVQSACAAAGVRILGYQLQRSKHKPGDTLAVGAVEAGFKTCGRSVLEAALRALRETRDGRASLVVAPLVSALCAVLSRNPVWLAAGERLGDVVKTSNFEGLLDTAASTARKEQVPRSVVIESAIERAFGKAFGPGVAPRERTTDASSSREAMGQRG